MRGFMNGEERSPIQLLAGYDGVGVSADGRIVRKHLGMMSVWMRCEYWEDFGTVAKYAGYDANARAKGGEGFIRRALRWAALIGGDAW